MCRDCLQTPYCDSVCALIDKTAHSLTCRKFFKSNFITQSPQKVTAAVVSIAATTAGITSIPPKVTSTNNQVGIGAGAHSQSSPLSSFRGDNKASDTKQWNSLADRLHTLLKMNASDKDIGSQIFSKVVIRVITRKNTANSRKEEQVSMEQSLKNTDGISRREISGGFLRTYYNAKFLHNATAYQIEFVIRVEEAAKAAKAAKAADTVDAVTVRNQYTAFAQMRQGTFISDAQRRAWGEA
ncbi:MAG: hypothetical protein H0X51_09580 [Parachlamydiaceae bacterium]|nr:hypothetical protein [Parachlamydiaceae bacterium]